MLNERVFREAFLFPSSSAKDSTTSKKGKGKGKRKSRGEGAASTETTGAGSDDDPELALAAFAERNQDGALKTRPKGFHPDHRDMQLLKLKNFTVGKKIADGAFTVEDGGQEEVVEAVRAMVGFVSTCLPLDCFLGGEVVLT